MHLRLPFVIHAKAFYKSFKGAKCVSITISSSNINEDNFKNFTTTKTKNVYKKHLSSNIDKVIKTIVVWVNGVVS